ncbi:MAG: hypothetical protein IJ035_02825 [Oscillospiraceae bacterium]|nr:hypothetical protein [Oscillospiraceae bacterium]
MISQGVIYSVLIGIVLTGVVPLIGGIALLAMGKIKGSSFWAGVLAFIIAALVSGIGTIIVAMPTAMTEMDSASLTAETPVWQLIAVSLISAVALGFAMLILIKNCMKTRTFKAAVSAGLGFAIPQLLSIAFSLVSMYLTFSQINSGAFDQIYAMSVDMGVITKEMVAEMKAMYTEFTVNDAIAQVLAAIGTALLMVAAAVVIMLFVIKKQAMIGTLIAIGGIGVTSIATSVITNTLVAGVIAAAIGAAAFICAYRTKDSIVPPEKPAYANDSFMQSVASAKEEN